MNPPGSHMDHKNRHIWTNRQRQKLSIAVFEAASWGPSHGALDQAVFFIKSPPNQKRLPPGTGISLQSGVPWPPCSQLYIDIFIMMIVMHVHTYIFEMHAALRQSHALRGVVSCNPLHKTHLHELVRGGHDDIAGITALGKGRAPQPYHAIGAFQRKPKISIWRFPICFFTWN